ncbi:hypothetical protein CHARACLAT_011163 [Characodon lateralis]|uniref:Uncharacterized protein n=1 Tax=Characodon lateralis TaxID=208331 RepID=A0ABU7CXA8_9TELE|nr:hypothetical protein [Characodon lateralis]
MVEDPGMQTARKHCCWRRCLGRGKSERLYRVCCPCDPVPDERGRRRVHIPHVPIYGLCNNLLNLRDPVTTSQQGHRNTSICSSS